MNEYQLCGLLQATRKGIQESANKILEVGSSRGQSTFLRSFQNYGALQQRASSCNDKNLGKLLLSGIGYHSAALSFHDRTTVEDLFREKQIHVLLTTSTLASGVNLPAYLVIIKNTRRWTADAWGNYDRMTLLQMMGRAGRPQYDTSGTCVIMTSKEQVPYFQNLLNGREELESQLALTITEHLNAEIVLQTVNTMEAANSWLRTTFYYQRVFKNPRHYGLMPTVQMSMIDDFLRSMVLHNVRELEDCGIISVDWPLSRIQPLLPGSIMSRLYIRFKTMKHVMAITSQADERELLMTLCRAEEYESIKLRRAEKTTLNAINATGAEASINGILYPVTDEKGKIKKRISTSQEKILILINHSLSDHPMDLGKMASTLAQDIATIFSSVAPRLMKAMSEVCAHKAYLKPAETALALCACLERRQWKTTLFPLRQLEGIGPVLSKQLLQSGISSFADLQCADPRRLEALCKKNYPWGNTMKHKLVSVPSQVKLEILLKGRRLLSNGVYRRNYTLRLTADTSDGEKFGRSHESWFASVTIGLVKKSHLVHFQRLNMRTVSSPMFVDFTVFEDNNVFEDHVRARLTYSSWVGCDVSVRETIQNSSAEPICREGKAEVPNDNREYQTMHSCGNALFPMLKASEHHAPRYTKVVEGMQRASTVRVASMDRENAKPCLLSGTTIFAEAQAHESDVPNLPSGAKDNGPGPTPNPTPGRDMREVYQQTDPCGLNPFSSDESIQGAHPPSTALPANRPSHVGPVQRETPACSAVPSGRTHISTQRVPSVEGPVWSDSTTSSEGNAEAAPVTKRPKINEKENPLLSFVRLRARSLGKSQREVHTKLSMPTGASW
eukprot:scaffold655_cov379-Prasinococcus_capsulatus_cf.AAC.22